MADFDINSERPQARHTHYVSLENGIIHPALTSPRGYEDDHPTEWRPATFAEIERFRQGVEATRAQPEPLQLPPSEAATATPKSVRLAEDEPEGGIEIQAAESAPVPPAPVVPPPPPPSPVIPPAPAPVAPQE